MSNRFTDRKLRVMHLNDYLEKVRSMCRRHDDRFIAKYIGISEDEVARVRASMTNTALGRPRIAQIDTYRDDTKSGTAHDNVGIREATIKLGNAVQALMQRQAAGA